MLANGTCVSVVVSNGFVHRLGDQFVDILGSLAPKYVGTDEGLQDPGEAYSSPWMCKHFVFRICVELCFDLHLWLACRCSQFFQWLGRSPQ